MKPPTTPPGPRPRPSRSPVTAWAMIAAFVPLGGWLVREIRRTIGLDAPHFWVLLRTDRVFDLAMLDFALTAGWALMVLGDRAGWRGWRFWVALPLFCVVPTLGIALFLLLDHRRGGATGRDDREPVGGRSAT